MPSTRSKIAAGATIASLAALGGVAFAAGGSTDTAADAVATSAEAVPTPEVRTEVVRRTIHRRVTERGDDHRRGRGRGEAEPGDDRGAAPMATTTVVAPAPTAVADDHGDHFEPGDDHGGDRDRGDDDDSSGPGSGHGNDDSSGHGSGHGDDD